MKHLRKIQWRRRVEKLSMMIVSGSYGLPLSAFEDVVFTVDSIKARSALAHKAVDVIPADGTVPARLAGTLVYLRLTVLPFKTWAADA